MIVQRSQLTAWRHLSLKHFLSFQIKYQQLYQNLEKRNLRGHSLLSPKFLRHPFRWWIQKRFHLSFLLRSLVEPQISFNFSLYLSKTASEFLRLVCEWRSKVWAFRKDIAWRLMSMTDLTNTKSYTLWSFLKCLMRMSALNQTKRLRKYQWSYNHWGTESCKGQAWWES